MLLGALSGDIARGRCCKRTLLQDDVARCRKRKLLQEDVARGCCGRRQCETTMRGRQCEERHWEREGDIIHCKGDYAKDDGMTHDRFSCFELRSLNSRSNCHVHPPSMICGS